MYDKNTEFMTVHSAYCNDCDLDDHESVVKHKASYSIVEF